MFSILPYSPLAMIHAHWARWKQVENGLETCQYAYKYIETTKTRRISNNERKRHKAEKND